MPGRSTGCLPRVPESKIWEEGVSGIRTPQVTELDEALADLIVGVNEADSQTQETAAQKRKAKDDKDTEEIRKRAMKRLGDRIKRSENKGKGKKRRSSETNILDYLKERNESLDELRKQEVKFKTQELKQEE